jgi:patatin-like phospholipase/acyl hydrolase
MNEDTTHRLFREAAAQAFPVGSRRRRPIEPPTTFEQFWESNHEAAAWDKTWANVSVVKEIARKAWMDGYDRGAQDTW